MSAKDEAGKRYGRLTVVEKMERDLASRFRRASAKWLCRCDCGSVTRIFGNKLRNGTARNCLTCERALVAMGKQMREARDER
jgi:hypothetical protein